ncbi:MAG: hypothetical protein R3264_19195, partial [Anaerolineae bacterium]|nr:hypothetical protein [Anaerolineae bacterium]
PSAVWAGDLRLAPLPFYAIILPYAVLLVLIGGAGWHWWRATANSQPGLEPIRLPVTALAGIAAGLLLASTGYLVYQHNQTGRVYDAGNLRHFVGQPLVDGAAEDGRAWLVDPAVDAPQKAIYGPFDIYEPGVYRVTYRVKVLEGVAGDQAVARLQVNATDTFQELVSQPLLPEHFSEPDSYHHFVLTVTNPRRQALSFDLHYTGLAALAIDGVAIEQVGP